MEMLYACECSYMMERHRFDVAEFVHICVYNNMYAYVLVWVYMCIVVYTLKLSVVIVVPRLCLDVLSRCSVRSCTAGIETMAVNDLTACMSV